MTKQMSEYAMISVSWVLIALLMMTTVLGFGPIRTGIAWRKFEYRNLAKLSLNDEFHDKIRMTNETYAQIRKKVDRWSYSCDADVDFTDWIKAIQKATIVELGPGDPWTDNEDLIQVRRMRAEDLESQVDLPESKHEYEDTLDVIKLPLPIPGEKLSDASQFLFVRPDEYALFKCFTLHDWCILTGNPGISKSWFQWKFILFCYRLDLFDQFSPVVEEIPVVGIKPEPFIPQLIVRTVAGKTSWFFFVGRNDTDVFLVDHSLERLDRITDVNTTILWEPGSRTTPVYYEGVKARIIATVSPKIDCIHEFLKSAIMFFMPCPSELQIRLMGQVYRRFATEMINCPSDAEIHERVINFGPFIRTALRWSSIPMKRFVKDRQTEIEGLVKDPIRLRSRIQIMEPSSGKCLSHRSVRFVVPRNSTAPFLGYTDEDYEFSCDVVLRLIQVTIAQMGIQVVKEHLIAINQGSIGLSQRLPIFLERIFEFHSLDKGIKWKYRPMLMKGNEQEANWDLFRVNFTQVEGTITTFQEMVENFLYYPEDRSFPLVDMYYKTASGLIGIQATMAKEHAKNVSAYQNFYDQIDTSPENTPLKLYYLIMPCNIDSFEGANFPPGKFWDNYKKGIAQPWKENITFFALLPPSSFEANMPEFV